MTSPLSPAWVRATRNVLTIVGIVAAAGYWWFLTSTGGQPVDVRAYWVADPSDLYGSAIRGETSNAFLYSPAFELAVRWGHALPFDLFVALWRGVLLSVLVYLAGPFTIFVLFAVPVASEINAGNIQILLALAIVWGFRWSGTWAFVILTKLTPGIGLLWFVLRRRWRDVGIALTATAVVAGFSLLLGPGRWFDYLQLLTGAPAPAVAPYYLTFWQRLPFALAFIVFGAWRGYRWPVVVGSTLALPVYYIISSAMLVGVLPFLREELGRRVEARWPGALGGTATSPTSSLEA